VWFSSRHSAVTSFDGKDWRLFSDNDGLAKGGVTVIYEDNTSNLWFGTDYGNVCRFDGTKWQTLKEGEFWPGQAVPRPCVEDIKQDNAGNIWVSAYKGGISRYDGANWQTYTTNDGLASNNAYTIFMDRDGKVGVITDKGVNLFTGTGWQSLTQEDGLPEGEVRAVSTDYQGNLWFGSLGGGVGRYRP
jgi:ligand-binding sensor domain-containing protein